MSLARPAAIGRVLALAVAVLGFAASPCVAQGSESPMQFWLRQSAPPRVTTPRGTRSPVFRPRRADDSAARRPAPSRPVPTPAATTFVVAAFGGPFGGDLARGLADVFADDPKVDIVDATRPDATLAQEPTAIWADAIDAARARNGDLAAATMMVGEDDLRPLADGRGGVVQPGSPAWKAAYGRRIDAVASVFKDRHVPLVWVGLPPVRDPERAGAFADLNAIVREHAAPAGATFVDIWGAFSDDSGQFSGSGPDVEGRTTRLRRGDGFTRAGARKLASFAEPDLKREDDRAVAARKLAAIGTSDQQLFDQALEIDVNSQIRREAGLPPLRREEARVKDGPVLPLTAAPLATDGRLDKADARPALAADAEAVLVSGLTPPSRRGRIDDFTWPKP